MKAWESTIVQLQNNRSDDIMDGLLYGQQDVNNNRYTCTPDRYNPGTSYALSFAMSKSSDMSNADPSKTKRNRKRQREGAEPEDRVAPGSIGPYLHQRMLRPLAWSKKEDEVLTTLVLQFGSSWLFICWVFLQEHLNNRSRQRHLCHYHWSFLQRSKARICTRIPSEAKFLWSRSQSLQLPINLNLLKKLTNRYLT